MRKKKNDQHPMISNGKQLTFEQRASDKLSDFFGSWSFLIGFIVFLLIWMMLNVYAWVYHWDPYPFILLNLILSCISAMQAPVILMSQNRQTERDRIAAKYDYAVNRKAEREIQAMMKDLESIKRSLREIKKATKAK